MNAEQFNNSHPVGTEFTYFSIKGIPRTAKRVTTTSEAWTLACGETVVKVSGVSGGVSIENLEKK